jgi:penicillin-binding protein 1C
MKTFLAWLRHRWYRVILALIGAGALAVWVMVWFVIPMMVELPDGLSQPPVIGTEVTDREGRPLRKTLNSDGERVVAFVSLDSIPDQLIHATLAAEDQRFWTHGGVDLVAIARALRDNYQAERAVSGASTVTQQLVKISAPGRKRNIRAKLGEFLAARKLEMVWTKEEILTAYFNRLDYGNLNVGAEATARGFFGKPLQDCSLAECALLAGLPQAPSRLNPYRAMPSSKKRQEWILHRMVEEGMISETERDDALAQQLLLKGDRGAFEAPHFVDQLMASFDEPGPAPGELRTTLDLDLQKFCETTVRRHLGWLRDKNVTNASVVVIDNPTGDVLALVGSANYHSPNGGQNNGAMALRSPGSTLKPFTYLVALERGATPATIVADLPIEFMTGTGIYRPENYDKRHYGPTSYRRALANSLNISAVRVLDSIGGTPVLINSLAACGITSLTQPPEHYGLGLTIGNAELRLLELTNAYACLARLGEHLPWRMASNAELASPRRIFDADACYLLADMLSDPTARAAAFGPNSILNFPFSVACKTGTSSDFRDNWTIGFTSEFTVGVWAGNFEGTPMQDVSGVSGAGPIFRDVILELNATNELSWYPRPESIVEHRVDPATGLPVPKGIELTRPLTRKSHREKTLGVANS